MADALDDLLTRARARRFVWGRHDCATFAAEAVDAQMGTSFATYVRTHYLTEDAIAYLRLIKRHGGLSALAQKLLGEPAPAGKAIWKGDIVLALNHDDSPLLAVAVPPVVVAPAVVGLQAFGMSRVLQHWPILPRST